MFLIHAIVRFLLQSLCLKLSVEVVRAPGVENHYSQALRTSALLGVLSLVCGLIPLIGWFVYVALWCVIVMKTYKLTFTRGIFVALSQGLLAAVLTRLFVFFNLLPEAHALL